MNTAKISCEESSSSTILPVQVQNIRNVLKNELKIEVPNHCDEFIARCIRLKDGNVHKTVALIQQFQRAISELSTWDVSLCPNSYQDFYNSGVNITVKTPKSLNSRIFILQAALWDPNKLNFDQIFTAYWLFTQLTQIIFQDAQSNGSIVIYDFSNFSLQHALAVNHFKLLKIFKWMQYGVAGRYKSLHVIFHPRVIGMLYKGVKPFLKEKMKNRIIFHGNCVKSLHQHVDPKYLPKSLGGPWPNDSADFVDKTVIKGALSKDEFFKDMIKFGFPSK